MLRYIACIVNNICKNYLICSVSSLIMSSIFWTILPFGFGFGFGAALLYPNRVYINNLPITLNSLTLPQTLNLKRRRSSAPNGGV